MSIGRDLWLGGGVLSGALAGALLRSLWSDDDTADEDDEQQDSDGLGVRQLLMSPGPIMAATGISRQAANVLKVDEEQHGGLFATGFGIGMLLVLLSNPLRRFLPI